MLGSAALVFWGCLVGSDCVGFSAEGSLRGHGFVAEWLGSQASWVLLAEAKLPGSPRKFDPTLPQHMLPLCPFLLWFHIPNISIVSSCTSNRPQNDTGI